MDVDRVFTYRLKTERKLVQENDFSQNFSNK